MRHSFHLLQRVPQRGFELQDIDFIIKHTKPQHRAGVKFYQLRDKDLPAWLDANDRRCKLVGTTVIVSACGCSVETIYRNQHSFRQDLKKKKYNHSRTPCPHCGN